MALVFDSLVAGKQLTEAAVSIYGPVTTTRAQIDAVTFSNASDGSDATVSLWLTSGGAPSDLSLFLKDFPVDAGETKATFDLRGHVINPGMELYALASVTGVVTVFVSGRTQAV